MTFEVKDWVSGVFVEQDGRLEEMLSVAAESTAAAIGEGVTDGAPLLGVAQSKSLVWSMTEKYLEVSGRIASPVPIVEKEGRKLISMKSVVPEEYPYPVYACDSETDLPAGDIALLFYRADPGTVCVSFEGKRYLAITPGNLDESPKYLTKSTLAGGEDIKISYSRDTESEGSNFVPFLIGAGVGLVYLTGYFVGRSSRNSLSGFNSANVLTFKVEKDTNCRGKNCLGERCQLSGVTRLTGVYSANPPTKTYRFREGKLRLVK